MLDLHDCRFAKVWFILFIGVYPESERQKNPLGGYVGGEQRALELLSLRIEKERKVKKLY